MQEIFDPDRQLVPVKAWLSEVDELTLAQATNMAALPFAHSHVALMPDAHVGFGMPIGGVLAADGYVVPHAVGVDIGCGMHARRTNIEAGRLTAALRGRGTALDAALDMLQRAVPAGNGPGGNHRARQEWLAPLDDPEAVRLLDDAPPALAEAWERSAFQIGTLGGGNHFAEFQADEEGFVWLMLHSGSRALGRHVCDHYDAIARDLDTRHGLADAARNGLAALPVESEHGAAYLRWMRLCMAYALENRRRMLDAGVEALFSAVRGVAPDMEYLITEAVDTHHNYADLEHHFGEDVYVHRKGAVRAREGEMVIIPGSMETGSYIARGKGNPQSFETCSHGAGRRLSRTAAKRERTAADVLESLKQKGIALAKRGMADVAEEAGHAYKDVDAVMRDSADLVEPVYRLRPLGVMKG
jgi:tRNA-splicing ligase RtcB (3'-phosphate/5'-hydroxy nucleic acid ligase)